MVDKLTKANTLQVLFETKVEGAKTGSLKGTLTLAAGNKAYVDLTGELDGKPIKLRVVSDGVNQRTGVEEKDARRRPTPKGFNDTLTAAFTGDAQASITIVSLVPARGRRSHQNSRDVSRAGRFLKLGKAWRWSMASRPRPPLNISSISRRDAPVQVTLWLDAKTNLPIRRIMRMMVQGKSITFTENYPSFVLNGTVDGKLFELPK